MNLLSILLLLTVNCSPLVCAQAVPEKKPEYSHTKPADSKAQLQFTTNIVEQNYECSNILGLKLRFTFKNIGTESIILDKRSFILRRMVSRDLKAAASKRYESDGRFEYFDGAHFLADPSDLSNFIVLKPGEAYSFDDNIGSFSIYDGAKEPPKGYLITGTHYLQLEVGTWSYFADPNPFQQKWKDQGFLWTEGLTSQPMPFTIEKERPTVKCP